MDDGDSRDDDMTAKIAFLGLGRMGSRMAANLAAAGFEVVLWNRTSSTAEEHARSIGAGVVNSPRAAAEFADVLITMLADEPSVLGVYEGADGLLAGLRPGTVCIDMGTTGPRGAVKLSALVEGAGASFVDAPVSGSTSAATQGSLTILAGGEESTVDRVRSVLEAVGSTVYHVGPVGAGSVMKLAVNSVIYGLGQAVSESLVLAECAGIDRSLAYDVFMNSAVAAPMVKYRRDAFVVPESTPAAFAMTLAAKDLRLIEELAEAVGAPMPQAHVNLKVIQGAMVAGLGDQDMAAVAVHLRGQRDRPNVSAKSAASGCAPAAFTSQPGSGS